MIPVVIALTKNYVVPAATCLYSILDTQKDLDLNIICLTNEEFDENTKEKLISIGKGNFSYTFYNLKGMLKDIYVDPKYTEATSYRLIIPDIVNNYDKAIYLDCDIIVRNDFTELYKSVNLDDKYLAAVYEPTLKFQQKHIEEIGCTKNKYFNAGFLIMNLSLMRKDKIVRKLLDASINNCYEFPDQDVLNIYCKDKMVPIHPKYNSIRTYFLIQYKQEFLSIYSINDWDIVQKYGTIHYTGGKPWNCFSIKYNEWWDYYVTLPNIYKEDWSEDKKYKSIYKIYKIPFLRNFIDFAINLYRIIKY